MRATYEELLRIARRYALEAYNLALLDTSDLVAGLQVMLSATRHHLRWLGHDLFAEDFGTEPVGPGEGPLFRLAQSLGAGADLLATQNRSTGGVLDDKRAVKGARSEVASIAGMGFSAALTRLASRQPDVVAISGGLSGRLLDVVAELDELLEPSGTGIGRIADLATRLPNYPVDDLSRIVRLAAEWQLAHEATSPRSLLTRDLRSTTAQLRTAAGYLMHLIRTLHGLGANEPSELRSMAESLRAAADAENCVSKIWRMRLSDVSGRSEDAAETAFVSLLRSLQGWLREGERLKTPDELAGVRSLTCIRELVDEIAYASHRVATQQEESVWFLIQAGHLFVPKVELAKRDPEFANRPSVWRLRHPQPAWVRTTRSSCFEQLTSALEEATGHFADAATISRRLAGTTDQLRPFGAEISTVPRVLSQPRWNRLTDEQISMLDAEPYGIDR